LQRFGAHRTRRREQEALPEADIIFEQVNHHIFVFDALGDEVDAGTRQQIREIFRMDVALRGRCFVEQELRRHFEETEPAVRQFLRLHAQIGHVVHREAEAALAGALTFEFTQEAYRSFGPMENEGLSALAERGFRFSMDHVTDLRMEPTELADRWFRFLKVPAKLLLNKAATAQSDIHPEDLADLLARSGIDLIAERIENENMVVDLLEYDVRFGQGFLFSAPRPVRAEALQGGEGDKSPGESVNEFAGVGASI
jgi:EAL domain-containing protein (putative c-di-GMP-specific phosphodiesterase class I)